MRRGRLGRRGQNTVEYLLMVCVVVGVVLVAGAMLKTFMPSLFGAVQGMIAGTASGEDSGSGSDSSGGGSGLMGGPGTTTGPTGAPSGKSGPPVGSGGNGSPIGGTIVADGGTSGPLPGHGPAGGNNLP